MGEKNVAINGFLSDKARFADLFNAFYFRGEQQIAPEELIESSEQYREVKSGVTYKSIERIRDVKMQMKSGGALRILAIESQNQEDYAMPFRCMQYDCLEYGKQYQQRKRYNMEKGKLHSPVEKMCGLLRTDRFAPVYTLCLYQLVQQNEGYRHLDEETVQVMAILLELPQIWKEREKYLAGSEEQEEYNMCQAMRELIEDGRMEGRTEGRAEGRTEGRAEGRAEGVRVASRIFEVLREDNTIENATIAQKCNCSIEEVTILRKAFGF